MGDDDLEDDDPNAPENSDNDMSENEETVSRPTSTDPSDQEQIMLEHNYSLLTTSGLSPIPTSSSPVNYSNDGLWPRSNTPPGEPPDPETFPENPGEKEKDPIEDMGRFIHTILDSDDEEEKQCKKDYNNALAMYTKVQLIHDEEKKEEDLENRENFEDIWNLSKRNEEDSCVEDLCESLGKLNIDEEQESENSDSSTNTIIETKKVKLSEDKEKQENDASSSPIPGGEEFSIVHSPGMESKNKLDTTKEEEKENPQTSSSHYKYGSQVIHEENCDCPYCYVRKSSKKQKMSFSINAASMMTTSRNTKCSSSRPAACSADISAIPTPMVNLKLKAHRHGENYLATIGALPDTGASINCVEESYARRHNLEIKPDTSSMIELINAEGKVMKVIGTTKIHLRVRGGAWVTTVALVCPRLSHQMLLSWQTQKKL